MGAQKLAQRGNLLRGRSSLFLPEGKFVRGGGSRKKASRSRKKGSTAYKGLRERPNRESLCTRETVRLEGNGLRGREGHGGKV